VLLEGAKQNELACWEAGVGGQDVSSETFWISLTLTLFSTQKKQLVINPKQESQQKEIQDDI